MSIRRWLETGVGHLWDAWPTHLGAAGGVVAGLAGIFAAPTSLKDLLTDWWCVGVAAGLVMVAVSQVGASRKEKSISRLETEKADLQDQVDSLTSDLEANSEGFAGLLTRQLRLLSQELGFGDSERISLYKLNGNGFHLLSRYTSSGRFGGASGRNPYPVGEGCIGVAWADGTAWESNLPNPKRDEAAYCHAQRAKWGVSPDTAAKFKMKSRAYYAVRLEDRTEVNAAVIVFESTKTAVIDPDAIGGRLLIERQRIADFLDEWRTAAILERRR